MSPSDSEASCCIDLTTPSNCFENTMSDELQHDVDQLLQTDSFQQKKKSSLFLLQLKEERGLSQAALNDVVRGSREVFQHSVGRIKAGVKQKLSTSGIDPAEVVSIDELFGSVSDPFDGLETSYLQDKFVRDELGCVVSTCTSCHYCTSMIRRPK